MTAKVIREWLSEYKVLPEAELHTYASTIHNNDDLLTALYDLFEDEILQEVIDPVCHQLFDFYRSSHADLRRFTLELIPTLIWVYLSSISRGEKKRCGGIEACLLGIYNLEILNADGTPKTKTYTIPTLAKPSIYHEPFSLASLALTESALLRYDRDEPLIISTKPLPSLDSINSQNRLMVMTQVLSSYNLDISSFSTRSHLALCNMSSRLATSGFENLSNQDSDSNRLSESGSSLSSQGSRRGVQFVQCPRINLSPEFLVEALSGIYFVMFNGQAQKGIDALQDIHRRANYQLFPEVLLVTNAIKNSLQFNPSGQPQDGPMGISVSLTPSSTGNPAFSKTAITNASFRAKKLPEDIEVPDEEGDEDTPPNYDEIVEQDKAKLEAEKIKSGTKLAKPLKSIMKKSDKSKVTRKESDSKKKEGADNAVPSPRNSGGAAIAAISNGEVLDPAMVSVAVLQPASQTMVDRLEMRSHVVISDSDSPLGEGFDSDEMLDYVDDDDVRNTPAIKPASHQREIDTRSSSGSSSGSITTPM